MSYQHDAGPNAHGVGVTEEQLHVASGLRISSVNALVEKNQIGIMTTTSIGTATGAASGSWGEGLRASASVWNPIMAVPQTPLLSVFAIPPAGPMPQVCKFRFRMTGLDQFGNRIVETTPWLEKTLTTTDQMVMIVMSKVFSVVDDCWAQTENMSNAGGILSGLAIGWAAVSDPTALETAAVTGNPKQAFWALVDAGATTTTTDFMGTEANWGVGTPTRVGPYGPSLPFPSPEYMGGTVQLVRETTGPALLNAIGQVDGLGQPNGGTVPATGFALGRSAAGWQGCPHKIGFFSNDAWATKITGVGLTGSSSRAGGNPTVYAHTLEDTVQINCMLRTTLGTSRGENATSSYPNG